VKRAVRNLIRFIAAGFVIFGGLEIAFEFVRNSVRRTGFQFWECVIGVILIALGAILFWASARLAEYFTDDIDD
jgi:TRAP-type C4-dicarboxylate transport system permease small subunit